MEEGARGGSKLQPQKLIPVKCQKNFIAKISSHKNWFLQSHMPATSKKHMFIRRNKKLMWFWSPRTTVASRTARFFLFSYSTFSILYSQGCMYVCMYVYFPLTRSYLQNINHSKYLQQLTIIRVKGTLGKGLCLSGLKHEKRLIRN